MLALQLGQRHAAFEDETQRCNRQLQAEYLPGATADRLQGELAIVAGGGHDHLGGGLEVQDLAEQLQPRLPAVADATLHAAEQHHAGLVLAQLGERLIAVGDQGVPHAGEGGTPFGRIPIPAVDDKDWEITCQGATTGSVFARKG